MTSEKTRTVQLWFILMPIGKLTTYVWPPSGQPVLSNPHAIYQGRKHPLGQVPVAKKCKKRRQRGADNKQSRVLSPGEHTTCCQRGAGANGGRTAGTVVSAFQQEANVETSATLVVTRIATHGLPRMRQAITNIQVRLCQQPNQQQ